MKYLIAGLGNYGIEYVNTRHNIGFDVIDFLAREKEILFSSKRYADVTEFKLKGKIFILIKPTTYMNLSGKAVKYWMEKERILPENLLVITDDKNLPIGKLRLRKNGSDGGHNGLKNINEILMHSNYPRLRFGIGNEFATGKQVDYVLGKWEKDENKIVTETIKKAADAVISFALEGIESAMNKFN
ncbi:MAG: aminoacyl-tRNA hydrolase [Fimbriimonadaceae bacterium]|nr:aminoacyl-tRNA hydrolase [Chitinophagales bacterium]